MSATRLQARHLLRRQKRFPKRHLNSFSLTGKKEAQGSITATLGFRLAKPHYALRPRPKSRRPQKSPFSRSGPCVSILELPTRMLRKLRAGVAPPRQSPRSSRRFPPCLSGGQFQCSLLQSARGLPGLVDAFHSLPSKDKPHKPGGAFFDPYSPR